MKLHSFLLLIALAFLTACDTPAPTTEIASLPNIVVVYCDDLGYGALGCFGNEVIRTPHIDRMAAEGDDLHRTLLGADFAYEERAARLLQVALAEQESAGHGRGQQRDGRRPPRG